MPVFGLAASHGHVENGMIRSDMRACAKAADKLDEVIVFRSTGPWSRRWIQRGYPTKNFHVKGKSSDWGPQAGFVPHLGEYSKVGHDADKAKKGTAANDHGIKDGYAARAQLVLSQDEIQMQLSLACEHPPRTALFRVEKVLGSASDQLLWAKASEGGRVVVFRAVKNAKGSFGIHVVQNCSGGETIGTLSNRPFVPLEVMTSSETGADNRPMTGDYDLMAVCPRWSNYGSALIGTVSKPGLQFGARQQPGQTFQQGTNLDKVLDMSSNTGQKAQKKGPGFASGEHPDMGNITPRILRAINTLNDFMGGQGPFRRVHHNAESHRNAAFGALTAQEMDKGDGLPLTVFQPASLWQSNAALMPYQDVSTLLTLKEFRIYAALLNDAGFYVPRNWTWGMSIRDRA